MMAAVLYLCRAVEPIDPSSDLLPERRRLLHADGSEMSGTAPKEDAFKSPGSRGFLFILWKINKSSIFKAHSDPISLHKYSTFF